MSSPVFHCSITRLRVRSLRFLPQFYRLSEASIVQLLSSRGFREGSVYTAWGLVFWTITIWESEQDMRSYMLSGAHKEAMPYLKDYCSEASVMHLQIQEQPTLAAAHRMMTSLGRKSSVTFPNHNHVNFDIGRAPKFFMRRPLKSKTEAVPREQASVR